MVPSAGLVRAWLKVLSLSKVTSKETVLILKGSNAYAENIIASRFASAQLGARTLIVELGDAFIEDEPATGLLIGNRAAVDAMKSADFVIDMMGIDRGKEQNEILEAGTRILLVKEPPETLIKLVPTEADKERVEKAARQLTNASSMRIVSDRGTQLSVEVGQYSCLVQYGYADEPGRWDHWPGAFVATWPNERSANGKVVLAPGDVILPFKSYVRTPIHLTIENGYITAIEGDFDARYLRDYMASFNDAEGYAVSHLGWGLYPPAHWTSLGMYDKSQTNGMESRSFIGNFMFSTGPNLEGGGMRDTKCHLDIPMLDCSVYLDNEPVTHQGKLVKPS